MVNVSNTNVMNVKDSNVTINNILEKNGQKGQFGSTTVTSNIENLNDPNNSSPNYDIDKFITISKVCIYIITLIFWTKWIYIKYNNKYLYTLYTFY